MSDTSKLKNDLHQLIDQIEDQATLEAIRTLLTPKVDAIYSLRGQALSQDQIENLLEESEADIKAGQQESGRTFSHQELKGQIQSWRHQKKGK